MERSSRQGTRAAACLKPLRLTVVGLNPTAMSEMPGFVTAVKRSFKGNINSQAIVV